MMSRCLDPETAAALVEGRLSEAEQAAVRAHLADCEICAELTAGLLLALEEPGAGSHIPAGHEQRSAEPGPRRTTSSRWPVAASVLAAAAAIILVVRLQPEWLPWFGTSEGPAVASLVDAAGAERSVEGRLTGGFPYGALRTPDRSAAPVRNLRLQAAAGELQLAAERDASQNNLHAWGVAQVAIGELESGLDTLEAAALQGTMTARLAADLGAARLAIAAAAERPEQLPRALEALEEATELNPALAEPWFTKAIVLERLKLPAQAASAWRRYLELDPSSGWSDEARRRLADLERQAHAPGWREFDEPLRAGTLDATALQRAVTRFPDDFRESMVRHVLPAWARSHTSSGAGQEQLAFARAAARALEPSDRDRLFQTVLDEIEASTASRRDLVARAVLDFGAGLGAQEGDRIAEASQRLETAVAGLRAAESSLAVSATLALARIATMRSRHDEALALASSALESAARLPSASTEARAHSILGLTAFTQGRWDDARSHYERAVALCDRTGEGALASSVHVNLSILHRFLGDKRMTWHHRQAAGRLLPSGRALQRHVYLTNGAATASIESLPETALLFQHEVVTHASAHLGPGPRTEAHLARARMLARAGRVADALTDLDTAATTANAVPSSEMRTRFERARALASAEVLARVDPARAAQSGARAAQLVDAAREPMRSAEARLFESRALAAMGRVGEARVVAIKGITDFERVLSSIDGRDPTRVSAVEPVWALYSEASRLYLREGDAARDEAFALIERGRSRMLVDQGAVAPLPLADVRAALAPGEALMMFDQAPDDLLIWWISTDAVRVERRDVSARAVEQLVARHRRSLDRGTRRDATAADLFDLSLGLFQADLGKTSVLAVIPDAAWSHVAWPVLWDRTSGIELVERTAVMIAPSAAVALRDRPSRARRGERVVVVSAARAEGRRDLPGARQEAREIAALYRANELLEGEAATPAAVLDRVQHAGIVHVASHALDVPSYPRMSHLVLSGDDGEARLFVHEIARVDLSRTQLVVLAACATAGRAAVRGEGTVGVAWGFLAAGARRVIATLHEIEDAPARTLFTGMHRRIAAGMRPMLALHEVQQEMAAAGESPRVWGAVTAIGAM